MKKLIFFLIMFTLFLSTSPVAAGTKAPRPGELFPVLSLPIPKTPEERAYLGLSGEGLFKLFQLKSQVVIIEILSMYCPYCQREAPLVNELYQAIEDNPDLKGKIKVLGIGVGNSVFEVGMFKKRYAIPFPLFADEDLIIHKLLGETRTPYFMAVKIQKDKAPRVIFSELGSLGEVKPFLKKIIQLADLK